MISRSWQDDAEPAAAFRQLPLPGTGVAGQPPAPGAEVDRQASRLLLAGADLARHWTLSYDELAVVARRRRNHNRRKGRLLPAFSAFGAGGGERCQRPACTRAAGRWSREAPSFRPSRGATVSVKSEFGYPSPMRLASARGTAGGDGWSTAPPGSKSTRASG